ncbi:hypothetical protein [Brachybacterium massiliense]|uniref:hypothetical protein n=1 Tax=Brachybacterium massiliense TaxID=1755098 RepID=UPI000B3BC3E9|nr:hypothetical protein [Brachybacterium massiliense]
MQWLPWIVGAVLTIGLAITASGLFRHRQHPWRILTQALSAATVLALMSLVGAVPAVLWWAPWLMAGALVAGVVVACRRLLVSEAPAGPTEREAARMQPPGKLSMGGEAAGFLLLLGIALVAG